MISDKSILIVEDEAGPRESLRMILKPFYNTLTASNGEQAIRIFQTQNVDIVTLDLNMPGMTGNRSSEGNEEDEARG